MFNRETNKSRGFGFVVFEAENSVDLVLEDRNHTIDGKSVRWNFMVLLYHSCALGGSETSCSSNGCTAI